MAALAVTARPVLPVLMHVFEAMRRLRDDLRWLPQLLSNARDSSWASWECLNTRGRCYPGQQKRQPDQDPSHLMSRAREHPGRCADSSFESQ